MSFNFLDPILGPFFQFPSLPALVVMSFLISLVITLIYKYATNQNLMKQLKDEIKEFQKEMKDLKDNPSEMMRIQKEAMKTNMKYMGMSMKATLITFIPVIFIFGWMNTHLGYEPIMPGEQFSTTVHFGKPIANGEIALDAPEGISIDGSALKEINGDNVIFTMSADAEGMYTLDYRYKEQNFAQEVIVGKDYAAKATKPQQKNTGIKLLEINYRKKIVMNLFGWELGWLGTYIIFSIIFSLGLRKLLKVY